MSTPTDITNVIRLAEEDAQTAIEIARSSDQPIAWITGNSHMPPLRAFGRAEQAWVIDDEGESWETYADTFEHVLDEAEVVLECPDYDNSLYVVDLRRFEYVESDGDDLNDDWQPRS